MLGTQKLDIQETIVTSLSKGPLSSTDLFLKMSNDSGVSKQGFYKALRELVTSEVITKNKQKIFLSPLWVAQMQNFFEGTFSESTQKVADEITSLDEGSSIVFKLKTLRELFFVWSHYFFIFSDQTDEPVVLFNSHNFWILLRSDLESTIYEWIRKRKKIVYSVVGYNTEVDKKISEHIRKEFNIISSHSTMPELPEHQFPAIIGDYIISNVLEPKTVKEIHAIYKRNEDTKKTSAAIQNLFLNKINAKVIVERNKKKAEKIRKKLMNHFVFYKK